MLVTISRSRPDLLLHTCDWLYGRLLTYDDYRSLQDQQGEASR